MKILVEEVKIGYIQTAQIFLAFSYRLEKNAPMLIWKFGGGFLCVGVKF